MLPAAAAFLMGLRVFAWSPALAAEAEPFPLEPADTSSPRASIESFLSNTMKGANALRSDEGAETIIAWFRRADETLDLSQVSPDRARISGTEAGLLIYEILSRVGLPDLSEIPGETEAEEDDIKAWTVPRTKVTITRVEEGDRAGEYLFSPRTVARALEDYEKVKHLPIQPGFVPGTYEIYVTGPDLLVPYLWAEGLPYWAKVRLLRNPLWKWFVMVVILALGLGAALLIRRLAEQWDRGLGKRGEPWQVGVPVFAVGLTAIPLIMDFVLERVIGVRFQVGTVLSKVLLALAFAAGVYFLFAFFEYLARNTISSRRLRKRSLNAHLVRVSARLLAIVVSVYVVIEATGYLGLHLAPVLAGLGIGGLAVALAARPTLENVIGGFTLFADRPVRIGDYCRFGEEEGWVEEIGLRSTRIRRRDDKLVTIPNAEFSRMQIQNFARIRERYFEATLTLRYETTPEQLRYCLARLREMLLSHPMVSRTRLHVRFLGFGAYSLDVGLFAYLRTPDLLEFRAIGEDINLRIMDIVKEAGTGFAFPSQTAYLGRDTGIDEERGRQAETKVQDWRVKGRLPFPEFDDDFNQRKEDTLDYPPKGSPGYEPHEGLTESEPKSTAAQRQKKARALRDKVIRPLRHTKP